MLGTGGGQHSGDEAMTQPTLDSVSNSRITEGHTEPILDAARANDALIGPRGDQPRSVSGPHFEVPARRAIDGTFDGPFAEFARRIRAELAPTGVLEDLLASRLVAASWRVNEALLSRSGGERLDEADVAELEMSLGRAVDSFARARSSRHLRWGASNPSENLNLGVPFSVDFLADCEDHDETLSEDLGWSRRFETPNDRSFDVDAEDVESEVDIPDPSELWRDRLTFDTEISDRSPVVKGTWITVGQIVSLVVDGWSWADILRTHPELTEADIRACLAYSVEEEGSGRLGDGEAVKD